VNEESKIPAAALASILCTEELLSRPSRPPDHEVENSALVALASALADSPRTILQTLADKVLEVLQADSAGLSLLTKDEKRFYWAAIAGAWRPHIGGGTPRDFGPCGDVLDHNRSMLFTHWERRYPYLSVAVPLADEGLLVPFYVNGKAVGTIWAIAHVGSHRKFDAEDLRLLESMGRFASAAHQVAESNEDLKLEIVAREKAEGELREITAGLEEQVRFRTEALEQRNSQLADAMSELTQLNRVATASELSATIAHEIRQPITGMVTNANAALRWLSRETPDISNARDALSKIVKTGHHAGEVITGIRALVKKDTQEKILTDINKLIKTVLALVYIDLRKHSIECQLDLSEQLPPVMGNEVQLQQVILNLVMNAIESMKSVEPRVLSIKSKSNGHDSIRVSIEDTGSGIDPSNHDRIFKPLFTTKARGMGMGLAICRSTIDSHDGRIWLSAGATRGSIFQFELPTGSTSISAFAD
jgi:signal transduction histidine kinase